MAKILIVDDSRTLRAQLRRDLSHDGHTVLEAQDGEHGLTVFDGEGPFDLIVSDVNMPVRDGLSMASEIRSKPAGRELPIFMLTSEGGVSAKQLGRSVGVTAWIVKPYDRSLLLAAVRQVAPSETCGTVD